VAPPCHRVPGNLDISLQGGHTGRSALGSRRAVVVTPLGSSLGDHLAGRTLLASAGRDCVMGDRAGSRSRVRYVRVHGVGSSLQRSASNGQGAVPIPNVLGNDLRAATPPRALVRFAAQALKGREESKQDQLLTSPSP
jgi:hypothetical protein